MKTVIVIGCTYRKHDEEMPAEQLYTKSDLFRKELEWAKLKGLPYYILSAKYGMLRPDEVIAPYNTKMSARSIWLMINKVRKQVNLDNKIIIALCGRHYRDLLKLAYPNSEIQNYYANKGIGEIKQKLKKEIEEMKDGSKLDRNNTKS